MANTKQRNYGIDLLRIVAMLLVTVLHIQGHGGVLGAAAGGIYYLAFLLEAAAFCAVNCYGLISGYVAQDSRWRPSALLALWCQVAFYSVGLTAVGGLLEPGSIGLTDLLQAALPVTFQGSDYWYFSAYVGLFIMMPVLNYVVRTMPPRRLLGCSLVLALGFGLLPTLLRHDLFYLRTGYSALWLMVLYLLGGCCRRCGLLQKWSGKALVLLFAGATLTAYTLRLLPDFLKEHSALYAKMGERFWGTDADWLTYISPPVLVAALALLVLFSRLELSAGARRAVGSVAPLCFSVYLIQNHPQVIAHVMKDRFAGYAALPAPLFLLVLAGTALGLFAVCVLMDAVRLRLFKLLHIKELCSKLEDWLRRGFGRALDALERWSGDAH